MNVQEPIPARSPSRLEFGFLLATVLACAVALSPNSVDPDLWGHVQYAEDALSAGYLHQTATHTFTAEGHRWINHENLSEFALAFGYRLVGARGMLAGKCLLGLGVIWLMLRSAVRQGVSLPVVCAYMILVATTLSAFWALRPQLASFTLLALMVVVLDRTFARWQTEQKVDGRWLCTLPVIMAIWTNSHGGFAAGLCLLVAYLGLRSLEAIYYQGRAAWRHVGCFALTALFCGLATLVNPYGLGLHRWLGNALRHPRPEITEWLPPMPTDAFFLPMVMLFGVILVGWCATTQRRDWTQIIILALCMWQAVLHSRHVPLVAVLAGFWLPVHLQAVVTRVRRAGAADAESRGAQLAIGGALGLALLLLVAKLDTRLRDLPVERDKYPVSAVQYMTDHGLQGKLIVTFNWAQYALAALPESQVAFDGRFRTCYPREVIDMHFDFLYGDVPGRRFRSEQSGPVDGHKVLDHRQPDLVLIDRAYGRPQKVLQQRDDFVLLYQDQLAQLWGRRTVYDNPAGSHYLAPSARLISEAPQTGSVTWPAFPERQRAARLAQTAPTPGPNTSLPAEKDRT